MNTEHTNQSTAPEPFGYFKTEPFGWTDCEKGDEGAVPLYEHATVQGLQSRLDAERGSLFAESQRKQQLQGQVEQLLNLVKSFGHKAGCAKNAFGEQCTCGVDEAIAAAEQAHQAEPVAPVVKESLTADRQAEPVAWVRFCSDGCYEGPLMNSSPAMDGARRTSGAWTPLFAAQPVVRDVFMALAVEVRDALHWKPESADITAIVDRYAAQPPAVAVPQGWSSVPQRVKDDIAGLLEDMAHAAQYSDRAAGVKADYELAEACKLLVAMLAAAPQAAAPCTSKTVESEAQAVLYRNDEAQDEPGPIIRQFGYQPLFNAISSGTKWRDGRTIEISVLAFQEALLSVAPSRALADIAAERRRQIEAEGWTPEHDDAHRFGNMAFAAACYAIAGGNLAPGVQSETVAAIWPWTGWAWSWWKPKDKRRNLVKAGALIAAEIERIDRAAQKGGAA